MGELFNRVQRAVREDRYLFSDHADNMLRERGITHWQIVSGMDEVSLLSERPATRPNPTVEVEEIGQVPLIVLVARASSPCAVSVRAGCPNHRAPCTGLC